MATKKRILKLLSATRPDCYQVCGAVGLPNAFGMSVLIHGPSLYSGIIKVAQLINVLTTCAAMDGGGGGREGRGGEGQRNGERR